MDAKRLEDKLDKIIEDQGEIKVTLAKQSVILEEHVKRTNLLEKQLEPVKKHVAMVNGVFKLLGVTATVAAIVKHFKGG